MLVFAGIYARIGDSGCLEMKLRSCIDSCFIYDFS